MERGEERRDLNLDIAPNHATGINNGFPASAMALSQQKHMKISLDRRLMMPTTEKNCAQIMITTSSFNSAALEEPAVSDAVCHQEQAV